jgi:acyl-[acyl-carrier-protein] desaturase
MTLSERARQFFTKVEVLRDLEARVAELMAAHEAKRPLWFPADLLDARPGECQEEHRRTLEVMQFAYIKAGFEPSWDKDPYRVFAYTTVQERATQVSHANTGRIVGEYEPLLGDALGNVASEEARHYVFYRTMVSEILARDPNEMLHSLAQVMPGIDMPGHTIPGFVQLADVIRRAGIYGPRDYLRIVQDQLKHWKIETLEGLSEMGKKAQEKLLAIPARLERVAQIMETRRTAKTFSFEVVFNREFAMD